MFCLFKLISAVAHASCSVEPIGLSGQCLSALALDALVTPKKGRRCSRSYMGSKGGIGQRTYGPP